MKRNVSLRNAPKYFMGALQDLSHFDAIAPLFVVFLQFLPAESS
ncbi:hypothetical protein [Sphingobacterium siyangense]